MIRSSIPQRPIFIRLLHAAFAMIWLVGIPIVALQKTDIATSLIPGWHVSIMPPRFINSAFFDISLAIGVISSVGLIVISLVRKEIRRQVYIATFLHLLLLVVMLGVLLIA